MNLLIPEIGHSNYNAFQMKEKLEQSGVDDVTILKDLFHSRYEHISCEQITDEITECFDSHTNGEISNLVCHGTGCNIGLILAKERASQIKTATFLSPKLESASLIDKFSAFLYRYERIGYSTTGSYYDHSLAENDILFNRIKYLRCERLIKRIASNCIDDIDYLNCLVMFALGDASTSKIGAYKLAKHFSGRLFVSESVHCNFLLTDSSNKNSERALNVISNYMNREKILKKVNESR